MRVNSTLSEWGYFWSSTSGHYSGHSDTFILTPGILQGLVPGTVRWYSNINGLQGTTLTFAVRFNFHLPYSNFHLPFVCFIIFHLKPSRTWFWHVKAYFLGQAWMPDHETCTHKSKPEIYKAYFPSGASKMQFSLAPQL